MNCFRNTMLPIGDYNRSSDGSRYPMLQQIGIVPPKIPPAKGWPINEDDCRDVSIQCEQNPLITRQGSLTSKTESTSPVCLPLEKILKKTKKFLEVIKPPYFIIVMLILLACCYGLIPKEAQVWLEWSPGAWWREPWRLLTYGLVHASLGHFALNALVALAVGWFLEKEQGRWRVLVVWIGGLAAGALGAGILQPTVRVVGSSAAVYALLTAHLPNVCLRFKNIPLWWFRPLSVVVLGASEAFWALIRSPTTNSLIQVQQEPVAWSAHLLGAAIGIPLGFVIFKADTDKFYIRMCQIVSIIILILAVASTIIYYLLTIDLNSLYKHDLGLRHRRPL